MHNQRTFPFLLSPLSSSADFCPAEHRQVGCIAVMMFSFLRSVFVIELMPGSMPAILCIIYVMVLGNGSNDDGSR